MKDGDGEKTAKNENEKFFSLKLPAIFATLRALLSGRIDVECHEHNRHVCSSARIACDGKESANCGGSEKAHHRDAERREKFKQKYCPSRLY